METIANLDVQMPPRTTDDTKGRRRHQPKAGDQDSLTRAQLKAAMSGLSIFFCFWQSSFFHFKANNCKFATRHKANTNFLTGLKPWSAIEFLFKTNIFFIGPIKLV